VLEKDREEAETKSTERVKYPLPPHRPTLIPEVFMDFIFILLIILSFPISHYIVFFIHSHHPAGHLHPLPPECVPAASDPCGHFLTHQQCPW